MCALHLSSSNLSHNTSGCYATQFLKWVSLHLNESLRQQKANNERTMFRRLHPKHLHPHESRRRQTYIRADTSPTTRRSLIPFLTLPASVCSLTVTAEERSVQPLLPLTNLLFHCVSSFPSDRVPLFYSSITLTSLLSFSFYLPAKYRKESR